MDERRKTDNGGRVKVEYEMQPEPEQHNSFVVVCVYSCAQFKHSNL